MSMATAAVVIFQYSLVPCEWWKMPIQKQDPHYQNTKVCNILHEMLLYGDGCTVSGKKDFLINIGGLLAFKDNAEWPKKSMHLLRIYEGNITSRGLSALDLVAMAISVEEMCKDCYISSRIHQTAALARQVAARCRSLDRYSSRQPCHFPLC